MMNTARKTDFSILLDGIGTFTFNRKSYGAQIKIDAVRARILGANYDIEKVDATLNMHASLVGLYSALVVSCPPGWENIEQVDMTEEPDLDNKILELYMELRARLDSFRVKKGPGSGNSAGQAGSPADAGHDGILDPAQVQPAA